MSLFKKITLSVITSAAMLTTTNATAQTTLFDTPFDATYNNTTLKMPYRIPALVETENATTGNKELIFFGDKRYCGMDIGYGSSASAFGSTNNDYYRIDIVCKRSTDGGKTWGEETVVKQGTATCGYGDIAVVSNRENQKEIVAFAATGNVRYSNTSSNIQITRLYSNNGGQSWTSSDYTSKIYGIYSSGYGRFFTSGRICQSKQIKVGDYYRLYAALCVWNGSNSSNALVIYSDDFGSSWNVLGSGYAVSGGDESKVEELPNGNVLISSRIYSGYDSNGRRRFNVFKYNALPTSANTANGSWGTVYSGIQYTGTTKPCNGEILLVPAKDASGNSCNILLHSEPYGTTAAEGRGNVSIFWKVLSSDKITSASEFAGTNWNRFPVSTTTSAYSTMIQQHDGTIAFAYEETIWGNGSGAPSTSIDKIKWGEHGYDLKYQNFTIAEITSNKYSYYAGEEETPVVETVATPVVSVSNSDYSATFSIACSTADATIYYTTDGTMPTTSSTKYTGTVTLSTPGTYTVKAIAVKDGCTDSAVATSATFTVKAEETGEGGGTTGGDEGTEGGTTTTTVTKYRFKNVHADGTVYYFAYNATDGLTLTANEDDAHLYTRTAVNETSGIYNFQSEDGNYLIFTGRGLSNNRGYNNALGYYPSYNSTYCNLTISKMVSGGKVTSSFTGEYYTIKGTRLLDGSNAEVYFVIKKDGPAFDGANSPYFNANFSSAFVIEEVEVKDETEEPNPEPVVETVETPVINPAGGSYTGSATFSITSPTVGATIYYTTNGTTPSVTNGKVYSGKITLTESATVKAIAVKADWNDSEVATAVFTITPEEEEPEDDNTITWKFNVRNCYSGTCAWGAWSSMFLDCAVELPIGVSAFRATYNSAKSTISLRKIKSNVIPAYYAVILLDVSKRKEITLTKTTTDYNPGENDLQGSLEGLVIDNPDLYYVLGHSSSGHYGFYHPASTIIAANKAYLKVEEGVSEIKVRFEDEDATGIEGIFTEEDDNAPIYDLTGRKVNDTSKPGIYIKNGKKYIVR